jgi:hypothetical protein
MTSLLASSVVGLATLRNGLAQGVVVAALATVLSGVVAAGSMGASVLLLQGILLLTWIPVVVLCELLRRSASQGLVLSWAVAGAAGVILGLWLVFGDMAPWWREQLGLAVDELLGAAAYTLSEQEKALWDTGLDQMSRWMTGVLVVSGLHTVVLSVVVSRWGHALLDRPGAFGREFREMLIPRRMAIAACVVVLLAVFGSAVAGAAGALLSELMLVFLTAFMFQGLAVAHCAVHLQVIHRFWLILIYLVPLFIPFLSLQVIGGLAVLGIAETWLDLRGRMARSRGPGNNGTSDELSERIESLPVEEPQSDAIDATEDSGDSDREQGDDPKDSDGRNES